MLIYANPTSTRPARRRTHKKGAPVATSKKRRQSFGAKKTHTNPTPNPTPKRRAVKRYHAKRRHRNPSGRPIRAMRGILGELASTNGLVLIASAVAAPWVADFLVEKGLPTRYQSGYTGLLAKGVVIALGAWALDRYAKQRSAALGFAIGGLGKVVADGIQVLRARQALPPSAPAAVADEIAANPAAFRQLMAGREPYASLNGYEAVPSMAGYELAPALASDYDSLN